MSSFESTDVLFKLGSGFDFISNIFFGFGSGSAKHSKMDNSKFLTQQWEKKKSLKVGFILFSFKINCYGLNYPIPIVCVLEMDLTELNKNFQRKLMIKKCIRKMNTF